MVEKKEGQLPEERKRVTEKCRSIVETNRETGLTETEAAKRLAADGANELEQEKKKSPGLRSGSYGRWLEMVQGIRLRLQGS